jgi:hypothetical protein
VTTVAISGVHVAERLEAALSGVVLQADEGSVTVPAERVVEAALFLRDDEALDCKYLNALTAVDWLEHFDVVYHLSSLAAGVAARLALHEGGLDRLVIGTECFPIRPHSGTSALDSVLDRLGVCTGLECTTEARLLAQLYGCSRVVVLSVAEERAQPRESTSPSARSLREALLARSVATLAIEVGELPETSSTEVRRVSLQQLSEERGALAL